MGSARSPFRAWPFYRFFLLSVGLSGSFVCSSARSPVSLGSPPCLLLCLAPCSRRLRSRLSVGGLAKYVFLPFLVPLAIRWSRYIMMMLVGCCAFTAYHYNDPKNKLLINNHKTLQIHSAKNPPKNCFRVNNLMLL